MTVDTPSISTAPSLQSMQSARCFLPYPPAPVPHATAPLPLSGKRFAVKDIFDVAGYPTGCGNPHALAASGIKAATAPAVQAWLDAGAVFAGKVVTDELAFSMNGKNAHFGAPRNGAAPDRIAGGSSSGSASAVSNGLADLALGSDTGGSVRAPASHCGLIGMRPTHGRIGLEGCMPLSPGFDTCGWFARDMPLFAAAGAALLGEDSQPLPALPRMLFAADLLSELDPDVQGAVSKQFQRFAPCGLDRPAPVRALLQPADDLYWAFRHIQGWQAWQSQGAFIRAHGLQLGPGVKERFVWSSGLSAAQVEPHLAVQRDFRARFEDLLGRDGVLVLPTMPNVAPLASQREDALDDYRNQAIRLLCLAGLSGCPQISLPLMRLGGIPLGLSLVGPRGSDNSLIALAARLMP